MAIPVEMPKLSDTMEEGVVVAWLAEEGQKVEAGDVIAQVETDKATMDLEVYDDGVLLKKVIDEGESVAIGGLIAVLGKEGEDISSLLTEFQSAGDGAPEAPEKVVAEASPVSGAPSSVQPAVDVPVEQNGGRIKSSPLARRIAGDRGIDLKLVTGSGPEGRIIKRDVESFSPASPQASSASAVSAPMPGRRSGADAYTSIPLTQMRKAISRRLGESKFTAPHFYLTAEFDMDNAAAARVQLNGLAESREQPKVSFNDLITKACALALREHSWVNASYLEKEGEIRLHHNIDVAVAVAIDEGLITPVIRNADQLSLGQIAQLTRELATRARSKQLQPEEYSGSTFTTSNLGMFGIDEFTAIINPPNACILAIGAVKDVPVVKNGELAVGKRMKVTLSCDHRVVDGASGAAFLASVRQYLEDPISMLL